MKILRKILLGLALLLALMVIIYLAGPRVKFEKFDNLPLESTFSIMEVEQLLYERNQDVSIKDGNEEKIVWAGDKAKTDYAFVYLHGFSASHEEGAPSHRNIANRYGANLLLTRLPQHGLTDVEAFTSLTPKAMVDYAKEAVKIGKSIGDKVIIISCSTGGTLSAFLAAADQDIEALIMYSPNFELNDPTTKLLTKPWGLQIAQKIKKGNYHEWDTPQVARPFWYHKYRLEGVAALQSLLDKTMTNEVFKQITTPVFVGYFYKDEEVRDFTVSTGKIMEVEDLISTPQEVAEFRQYPNGKAHVFISPFFNDKWDEAQMDTYEFLEQKLGLKPMEKLVLTEAKEGVTN